MNMNKNYKINQKVFLNSVNIFSALTVPTIDKISMYDRITVLNLRSLYSNKKSDPTKKSNSLNKSGI